MQFFDILPPMHRRTIQILSVCLFLTLVGWGFWTLLTYLGIPVHIAVLNTKDVQSTLATSCASGNVLCNGVHVFFDFLFYTFSRLQVFLWYAAICAAFYAAAFVWNLFRTSRSTLQWSFTPWKLLLLFVGLLWLLFTCLTFAKNGPIPFHTIVEPNAQVYQGAGEEALKALSLNYVDLKERGCLTRIGVFGGAAEASRIHTSCLQSAFFTRVMPPMLVLLLLVFELLILGRFLLQRVFRMLLEAGLQETVLSLGAGVGGWIILLWLGAFLHIYIAAFGWVMLLLVPVLLFRHAQYWINQFLFASWPVTLRWHSSLLLLVWFLLSYLALNYLNVVRPFPIGWDDLGNYLNRPKLLVSYGSFVYSMATFQWEYLTSLGFLLFGFESVFGATTALVINWLQGVLAILVVWLFGRTFFGRGHGLLSAALYYTLPLVGHFSFADMKIDNSVFTMGVLATYCMFLAFFRTEDTARQRRLILLSGVFAGFAFSMKLTAVMVLMALCTVLAGLALHWSAFAATVLLSCALFVKQGTLNVPKIMEKVQWGSDSASPMIVFACFALAGVLILTVAAVRHRDRLRSSLIAAAFFLAGFFAVVSPWLLHNNILAGNTIPRLDHYAPNTLTPQMNMFGSDAPADYRLPPELAMDPYSENCHATAGAEELDRYWGNGVGWSHYLTLPWRSVMNIDHAGYYVTTQPALLLFPLLLLLPYFWRREGRWLRWLWISTVFLLMQWVFFANGVPWYGIGVFLGLVLSLEALVAYAPDVFSRSAAQFFIVMSLFICLGMRFWQFESQRNLFEYPLGKISAETMRERTIPWYDDITDIVMQRNASMPDRPLLYRIGTFMPYFIPRNLEVIGITDHQLDTFNCLYQERDPAITLQRLKMLGFNSIIFDTNTATIERDPNGSLHQKVRALTDFLNSPEAGLKVIINDPDAGIAFLLIP